MKLRRSMLFMPGNNPGMLQNAGILGADSIILDLEDAVSISEKDSARILVRNAIKNINFYGCEVVVRVNPLSSVFGMDDLKEIVRVKPDVIMVPKADPQSISEVDEIISKLEEKEGFEKGTIRLFPLVETAFGLENINETLSKSKRITGVLLGAEDLTSDLGIKRTKVGDEIFYARCKVVSACKAIRVDAVDTPFTDLNDIEAFIADIKRAKSIGMTGKAAINPRQIDTIHEVFAPTQEEIKYALRVMEAKEEALREGKGVFSLDGKMVDAPIISRANTTLERAKLAGLL